jgi:hypothetical protein
MDYATRRVEHRRYLVVVAVLVVFSIVAPVAVCIPVPVVVPGVFMFKPAAISFPVTRKVPVSIMMRPHPPGPRVRWPSPITIMPLVVLSNRIPITVHPHELRAWSWRQNMNHTGRRWRANCDGDLSAKCRSASQDQRSKHCCPNETSHVA